jgi:hypothetical protein
VTEIPLAVGAAASPVVAVALVAEKGADSRIGRKDDVAAPSPIAAVWSTTGSALGAKKGSNPSPTVAGSEMDLDPVDEHGGLPLRGVYLSRR